MADGGEPVFGENPLHHCKADHSSDILSLEYVNLTPNPPSPGHKLRIEASGILLRDIEEGAYVNLVVKYGLIRLVNVQEDLCKQVSNVDMECPIKKGLVKIVKDVELPREIPPGNYHVTADAFTKDGRDNIICLEASVSFKRGDL